MVATFAEGEPQFVPGSFVLPELQEQQADRLFRVQRNDGSAAYVYCLIEHKSSPDSGIGLQLLRYLTSALVKVSEEAEHSGQLPGIAPVAELELRPPASAGAG